MTWHDWNELGLTLFEEAGDALFLFEPETEQFLDLNPIAQRLCGFTRKELLSHPVTYLFRSEVQGGLTRLRHAFKKTGIFHSQEGFLLRHQRGDAWVPVNLTITRLHAEPKTLGLITARDITERKEAEDELRRREAQLAEAQRLAHLGSWDWDMVRNKVTWSDELYRIYGRQPREFEATYEAYLQCVHPEDRGHVKNIIQKACRDYQPFSFDERVVRPDGTVRTLHSRGQVVVNEAGEPVRMVGTCQDITERKKVEETLARERAILRGLIDSIPDLIFYKDRDSVYLGCNAAFEQYAGRKEQDLIGLTDLDLFPREIGEFYRANDHQMLANRQPRRNEEWIEYPDGRSALVEVIKTPFFGPDGQVLGLIGISRDITERKRAEEEVRSSEGKYRSLIENLEQSVFLKDRELRFVAGNKPFCQSLGCSEPDLVGKSDFDFYPRHLAEKYRADDLRVLSEGKRLELQEENIGEGRSRTVRVVKTPLKDDQGQVVGVLGIFWDVSEQRLLEAQLQQAQKMEAIGQLAGGVAHDFNNLLTAILGNVSLLSEALSKQDPLQELLAPVEKAGWRAAELTSQLLGFSRRTPIRPQALDLRQSIEETFAILRRTVDPRIQLEVHNAAHLWTVMADGSQMNQVLMNLCLNARDAMPEGGRLALATENVTIDEEYTRLHVEARTGEFVCLTVRDTGHGMAPEIRQRIFEPFFTTKGPGKGTGLGLAMVFGIVKQHHGWIEWDSEVGQGACFRIYLPRLLLSGEPRPAPIALRKQLHGTETILLVDDEAIIRNLGRNILQNYGYTVLLAEDGPEAVELYRRERQRIDLIIIDLTMPRLSGQDTLRQLLLVDPDVRVLFSSGYSAEHVPEPEHYEQVLGFIGKPYRPEELAATVRAALDRAAARAPSPA